MAKQWYAVHTYAGQENKVQQNIEKRSIAVGLQHRISRVIVPVEEVKQLVNGKTRTTLKKIFPGYVLVEMDMDDETWHFVRQTVGVTGFLGQVTGTASRPAPLQPEEVARLLRETGEDANQPIRQIFHKGDHVNVIAGPFSGSEGRITEINTKTEKLKVNITLFGRETPIDLDFAHVERVA